MRRPRHKLQVSTFPFLAVLLGAMGSLIFLLLVMDRRAKLVARNKLREAQESRLASLGDAERRQRDDLERQQRLLHDKLAAQDRQLRDQLQGVLADLARTDQNLQARATAERKLEVLLASEQAKLTRERDELRGRQSSLSKFAQLEETSKTELAKLTRDLLELEQALEHVKTLKSRQQPTYSLVPYQGQRGQNRVPIYIECTRSGLVFLPDQLRLASESLDVPRFRAEVERRHGPLVKALKADPFRTPKVADQPYVLFLVRPDGIESYYRGQSALRGFQIDFGYELVDADWTLDVPADHRTLAQNFGSGAGVVGPGPQPGSRGSGGNNTNGNTNSNSSEARGPGGSLTSMSPAGTGSGPGTSPSHGGDPLAFRAAQPKKEPASIFDGPPPSIKIPGAVVKEQGPTGGNGDGQPQTAAELQGQTKAGTGGAAPVADDPAGALEAGSAMARLSASSVAKEKMLRASPASLGRVIGNRDFIVTVACYNEGVVVTPGSVSFVLNQSANTRKNDQALVDTVAQLVARRQATVRPGEPPYRPVVRFEVREGGRRTYHHVYPLLESLRFTMVREDVEE